MSNKKRNMLEAFQASAQEAEGEHAPHTNGGAGGPFAAEGPAPEAARAPINSPPPTPVSEEVPAWAQALQALPLGPIAAVQLILLALVFWLGYLSGSQSETLAAPPDDGGAPVVHRDQSTPQPNQETTNDKPLPPAKTPYDAAFLRHAEDGVTLRVMAYDLTPSNSKLAWDTYDLLIDSGFPAISPRNKTESIFLFVGAAQRGSDLDGVKKKLTEFEDERGNRPFRDAYLVNIKDY